MVILASEEICHIRLWTSQLLLAEHFLNRQSSSLMSIAKHLPISGIGKFGNLSTSIDILIIQLLVVTPSRLLQRTRQENGRSISCPSLNILKFLVNRKRDKFFLLYCLDFTLTNCYYELVIEKRAALKLPPRVDY